MGLEVVLYTQLSPHKCASQVVDCSKTFFWHKELPLLYTDQSNIADCAVEEFPQGNVEFYKCECQNEKEEDGSPKYKILQLGIGSMSWYDHEPDKEPEPDPNAEPEESEDATKEEDNKAKEGDKENENPKKEGEESTNDEESKAEDEEKKEEDDEDYDPWNKPKPPPVIIKRDPIWIHEYLRPGQLVEYKEVIRFHYGPYFKFTSENVRIPLFKETSHNNGYYTGEWLQELKDEFEEEVGKGGRLTSSLTRYMQLLEGHDMANCLVQHCGIDIVRKKVEKKNYFQAFQNLAISNVDNTVSK